MSNIRPDEAYVRCSSRKLCLGYEENGHVSTHVKIVKGLDGTGCQVPVWLETCSVLDPLPIRKRKNKAQCSVYVQTLLKKFPFSTHTASAVHDSATDWFNLHSDEKGASFSEDDCIIKYYSNLLQSPSLSPCAAFALHILRSSRRLWFVRIASQP